MIKILSALLFLSLPMLCLHAEADYIKMSNNIVFPALKFLKNEMGLQAIAKGGGMMHDVELVFLHFQNNQKPDVNTARKLYVESTQELLKRYNADKTIRPYLHNYPFTIKNVDVMISFEREKSSTIKSNAISLIVTDKDNCIVYFTYDANMDENVEFLVEPYEGAVKTVLRNTILIQKPEIRG